MRTYIVDRVTVPLYFLQGLNVKLFSFQLFLAYRPSFDCNLISHIPDCAIRVVPDLLVSIGQIIKFLLQSLLDLQILLNLYHVFAKPFFDKEFFLAHHANLAFLLFSVFVQSRSRKGACLVAARPAISYATKLAIDHIFSGVLKLRL